MNAAEDISIEAFLAPPATLVLSGGVGHPFGVTTNAMLGALGGDVDVDIIYEPDQLADLDHDLLIVNALWWTMGAERYADDRAEWARSPSADARRAVARHVAEGGSIAAFHTACICFDDWQAWGDYLGGRWNWDRSSHPPLDETEPIRVEIVGDHVIVDGLSGFEVIDEVYGWLDLAADVEPLAASAHGGAAHPVLWARELSSGSRVVVDTLGHDLRSVAEPTHHEIIRRSLEWALGGTVLTGVLS